MNYYNEFDPFCAEWLQNLIDTGEIPDGKIDTRDMRDIEPRDLEGFTQCHFFAGVGGWPLALRLAGIPDDESLWTGSCPCQPFSAAGKRKGADDERHLWPAFRWLIDQCRPARVLGEQVASKDGRAWFAGVRSDLEALGYACGGADLCSAGTGAPHIRQRLYWFATQGLDDAAGARHLGPLEDAEGEARDETRLCVPDAGCADGGVAHSRGTAGERDAGSLSGTQTESGREWFEHGHLPDGPQFGGANGDGRLGQPDSTGLQQGRVAAEVTRHRHPPDATGGADLGLGNADGEKLAFGEEPEGRSAMGVERMAVGTSDFVGFIPCADGKLRRVEPSIFPLAHALPRIVGPGSTKEQRVELMAAKANRIGRLRGYGNAIDPELASEFIRCCQGKFSID